MHQNYSCSTPTYSLEQRALEHMLVSHCSSDLRYMKAATLIIKSTKIANILGNCTRCTKRFRDTERNK